MSNSASWHWWRERFEMFWAQVAIASLLLWATQQDRGPCINVDGKWLSWMVWFEGEFVR